VEVARVPNVSDHDEPLGLVVIHAIIHSELKDRGADFRAGQEVNIDCGINRG
jgi:hypothetical protein